jgi:gamma-glutamyltranspeptidase/glutathione hydrolase
MIATGHPEAARAAAAMLQAGGSAVDAAIAADAVMGVVEPMATSIGGDLLAMLVEADGSAHSYNGSGRSPLALDPRALEQFEDARLPERHALTVTTPGVVRGWSDLHARHGRLPWAGCSSPRSSWPGRVMRWVPWRRANGPCSMRCCTTTACARLYRAGHRRPPASGSATPNWPWC